MTAPEPHNHVRLACDVRDGARPAPRNDVCFPSHCDGSLLALQSGAAKEAHT
jgi:hypothetical protein